MRKRLPSSPGCAPQRRSAGGRRTGRPRPPPAPRARPGAGAHVGGGRGGGWSFTMPHMEMPDAAPQCKPARQQSAVQPAHLRHVVHHSVILLLLQPRPQLVQSLLQLRRLARGLGPLGEGEAAAAARLRGSAAGKRVCGAAPPPHGCAAQDAGQRRVMDIASGMRRHLFHGRGRVGAGTGLRVSHGSLDRVPRHDRGAAGGALGARRPQLLQRAGGGARI